MPHSVRDVLWLEALARLARTDRRHRDVFRPTDSGWEPPIDILEVEAGLLVIVALPGVSRDDMLISVIDGVLLVTGTRRWPISRRPALVHRVELPHGRFERRLPLPPGAYQIAGQDHRDGCLLLTLRRVE